jgi:hypothetical protein
LWQLQVENENSHSPYVGRYCDTGSYKGDDEEEKGESPIVDAVHRG